MDYHKLNAVTWKDAYPIPWIDDTLDTLSGACWFSSLDMVSGYWQVEVGEKDREKNFLLQKDREKNCLLHVIWVV